MDHLLAAIVDDNRARVKELLRADGGLATGCIREARLYQSQIAHWMYVGDTALHLAAAGYRLEIVRLLLAAGADPNAAGNHRSSTPLHYAADGYINGPAWDATRQVSTLRCLLDAGAAIHAQDKNGATPLHRAVRTRCAAAVELLLKAGADPTLKNKPGSTPFHLAVQNTGRGGSGADVARAAQRRIIETFLALGVSTALRDGKGQSVSDCTRSSWIREVLSGDPSTPAAGTDGSRGAGLSGRSGTRRGRRR
jgi:Ankyrin repeats (3 copies)